MSDPRLFRLRITFCKQGRLAMLSHLEVAHTLERTVRRSGLPFAVSQGFSPHMKLSFGSALPVGVGGTDEICDLLLTEYVKPNLALNVLQHASVQDLMVKACVYIESTAEAASVAFPVSTYEVVLSDRSETIAFPDVVRVVRKKKERELVVQDFLVGKPQISGNVLVFSLEQKPTGSLRPDVLLKQGGVSYTSITRIAQSK